MATLSRPVAAIMRVAAATEVTTTLVAPQGPVVGHPLVTALALPIGGVFRPVGEDILHIRAARARRGGHGAAAWCCKKAGIVAGKRLVWMDSTATR